MLDVILVGIVVAAAAFFVGRRVYRQITTKEVGCGCSGCGQSGTCPSSQSTSGCSELEDHR